MARWEYGRRVASWDPKNYDTAWTQMEAAGKDPHGEVAFVERLMRRHGLPATARFLDAGCGTGRVAIELDRRGFLVEGTDVDADMLGHAKSKAPHITWTQADLARLRLGSTFDVIVMAGNVILFVEPEHRPLVAPALHGHGAPGGLLVAGMQLARADGRRVSLPTWDAWMESAGFELVERVATWDDDPWHESADYVVSVHRVGARP
jgi:trans-aconitate methyltransferase